jgi:heme-degrading monooxygenase HmoA
MYMNRNEVDVTLGRAGEFEEMVDQWSGLQGQNAGFVGATLLQSFAYPGRYTLFSRWVDRDASVAASRRPQFKTFITDFLGSGLARPTRVTESYESVFEVNQDNVNPTQSAAERFIDFTLKVPMVAPAFEAETRDLAQVGLQHAPGVLSVRLRRSMGIDTRYLLLVITTDHAAARNWLLVPEVRSQTERRSINDYLAASPSGEILHVVKRYAGPAMAEMQPAGAAATRA